MIHKSISQLILAVAVMLVLAGCSNTIPEVPETPGNQVETPESDDPQKEDTASEDPSDITPADEEPFVTPAPAINENGEIDLTAKESIVTFESQRFGWRLLQELATNNISGNVVISPLSAEMALSMLANGAVGDTQSEIIKVLGFERMNMGDINSCNQKLTYTLAHIDEATNLAMANAAWFAEPIGPTPTYRKLLRENFDAPANSVQLEEMPEVVNSWCAEKTNGLISDIMDAPALVALTNAVYFKSCWSKAFDSDLSTDGTFYGADGTSKVRYMHDNDTYTCGLGNGITVLSIPFGNAAFTMEIYLPDEGLDIENCIADIISYNLGVTFECEVELSLPCFKTDLKTDLEDILRSMGINKAFESTADFSALSDYAQCVNKVIQSSSFEINETGGEGASVTIVEMFGSAGDDVTMPSFIKMDVNRPFIFKVSEKSTGAQIFLGAIRNL